MLHKHVGLAKTLLELANRFFKIELAKFIGRQPLPNRLLDFAPFTQLFSGDIYVW